MLVFGVGYRYIAGQSALRETNRIDVTRKFTPLGADAAIAAESTFDLLRQGTSWRYRNRISCANLTFALRLFPLWARGVFYSSSSRSWNKKTFQVGSKFPFRKHFEFELYYERDDNVGSIPNAVNAFGMTAYIYF
jgi:hypothetical protein